MCLLSTHFLVSSDGVVNPLLVGVIVQLRERKDLVLLVLRL